MQESVLEQDLPQQAHVRTKELSYSDLLLFCTEQERPV